MSDTKPSTPPVSDWATDYDIFDPEYIDNPFPIWDQLREQCPIAHTDRWGGSWLPTRYEDVTEMARNILDFPSGNGISVMPPPAGIGEPGGPPPLLASGLPPISSDPPLHTWTRRLVLPTMSPARVAEYEIFTRDLCRTLVDGFLARGEVDAAAEYAQQIPVRVIAHILGVPESMSSTFTEWVRDVLEFANDPERRMRGITGILQYLTVALDERIANPTDDFISELLQSEHDGEPIDRSVVMGMCALLLIAGIDTTWSSIGSSMHHLATHPDDRRRLLGADKDLWSTAIEELLRAYAPVTMARRLSHDVEFNGCPMKAGDRILMNFPRGQPRSRTVPRSRQGHPRPREQSPCRVRRRHPPLCRLEPGSHGAAGRHRRVHHPHPRVRIEGSCAGHLGGRPGARPAQHSCRVLMRSLRDTTHALDAGLAQIRHQFQVPLEFPPEVLRAADDAARREPSEHVDRTDVPFVTLDPEFSTDLDQAFTITRSGDDLLLQYAIADVAWFVRDGDAVDTEAWTRGMTLYLPDGKAGLYPPVLAEAAASLLPDGPRPAVVFHVRLAADGIATLDGAERAIVRTRAKLAYDRVTAADLPEGFAEFARRMEAAEVVRGAAPVDPPEQVVERNAHGYRLAFRPRLASETANAALSLATNMAVADVLQRAGTGLFRVMPEPDGRAIGRLRHMAHAFGMSWPTTEALESYVRTLDPNDPAHAAFLLSVRRAGGGAEYVTFTPGTVPWHSAVAATYAHATAPLRRLADRDVVQAVLAVANGQNVPSDVTERLARLPATMARAAGKSAQIERSVIDLAEAVMLEGHEGTTYAAVVVEDDDEISKIQLTDVAVLAKVTAKGLRPGDECRVRLVSADPVRREVLFERVA